MRLAPSIRQPACSLSRYAAQLSFQHLTWPHVPHTHKVPSMTTSPSRARQSQTASDEAAITDSCRMLPVHPSPVPLGLHQPDSAMLSRITVRQLPSPLGTEPSAACCLCMRTLCHRGGNSQTLPCCPGSQLRQLPSPSGTKACCRTLPVHASRVPLMLHISQALPCCPGLQLRQLTSPLVTQLCCRTLPVHASPVPPGLHQPDSAILSKMTAQTAALTPKHQTCSLLTL